MKNPLIILIIIFLILLFLFISAFLLYKPLRVLIPETVGMRKIAVHLYLDNPAKKEEAIHLRDEALLELNRDLFRLQKTPKILFCDSPKTFAKLGFKKSAARTVGPLGIVISPRGWEKYYLKHELIHVWQEENLGAFSAKQYPQWLIEGMAYSLSGDPRKPLTEPWEMYRSQFEEWYASIDKKNLGNEMRKLKK
jgi:hypothetical protein